MSPGNVGYRKTYNKSKTFHKHGYAYKQMVTETVRLNKEKSTVKHDPEMCDSVKELFDKTKR